MKKIVIPCIIALFSTACSTTNYLTEQEITSRYETVAQLQQEFTLAESANLKMLAPKQYGIAQEALKESLELAKDGKDTATGKASKGLQALAAARETAGQSRDMLDSVLIARDKAEQAGALNMMRDEYMDADQDLLELTRAIESGDLEKVREDRGELAKVYRKLELKSLKQDVVDAAEKAIADATEKGAKKLAPKTFQHAIESMALAQNILDVNRGNKSEAEGYAEQARWWAERSISVSETVKTFKQGDYSNEDIVLWYQDQFSSVMAPVTKELPLNYQHKQLMASMRSDLEGMVDTNTQLTSKNSMLKTESASMASAGRAKQMEMESKLTKTREELKEEDRKFNFIQSLFDEKEALVFRKKNEILVRAQGFDFPSGKSEIQSDNFALLQKIIKAIDEYPAARIVVAGHTDSVGDDKLNLALSQSRAEKVADFLVKVGQINADRVTFNGHGETRPVASNETKDGRAENRRVDITLIN